MSTQWEYPRANGVGEEEYEGSVRRMRAVRGGEAAVGGVMMGTADVADPACVEAAFLRMQAEVPQMLRLLNAESAAQDTEIAHLKHFISEEENTSFASPWMPDCAADSGSEDDEMESLLKEMEEEEEDDEDEEDEESAEGDDAWMEEVYAEEERARAEMGVVGVRAGGAEEGQVPLPPDSPPKIDRKPIQPVTTSKRAYDIPNFETR